MYPDKKGTAPPTAVRNRNEFLVCAVVQSKLLVVERFERGPAYYSDT